MISAIFSSEKPSSCKRWLKGPNQKLIKHWMLVRNPDYGNRAESEKCLACSLSPKFYWVKSIQSDCKSCSTVSPGSPCQSTRWRDYSRVRLFSAHKPPRDSFLGLIILVKGSDSHTALLSNIRNSSCLIAFSYKYF